MKSISLRNVPDAVYSALQEMAKTNRRSLQEQIKCILEQETRLIKGSSLAAAARWRKQLKDRHFSDVVAMIREDRLR